MDRKSIIVLVACVLLFLSWPYLVGKIFPPKPLPPGATNISASATNQLVGSTNVPILSANTNVPSTNTLPLTAIEKPSAPEQLQVIETPEARYTFTSYGGGLKQIELKEYQESVTCESKKKPGGSFAVLNKL